MFESSVNLQGTKTVKLGGVAVIAFESSVNLQGTKTTKGKLNSTVPFESSVNLQGTKTNMLQYISRTLFESSVNLQGTKTIAFTASVRIAKNKRDSESSHKYAAKHDITPSETSDTARIPALLKVSTMLIPQ